VSKTGAKKRSGGRAKDQRGKSGGRGSPKKSSGAQRAADFFGHLMPDTGEQSAEAYADRQTRRRVTHKAETLFDRVADAVSRAEAALEEDEATNAQQVWADRKKRRESDEEARRRGETRADIRQEIWAEERRRAMRQRDFLMLLSAATTLAAIWLAYLGVTHGQIEYFGASMFTTAFSGLVFCFHRIQGPQDEAAGVGQTPIEPPPFRWSLLDFQPEVGEQDDELDDDGDQR
jgi:hypothetical protein